MMSFDTCLREAARSHGVALGDAIEPFALLPYDSELQVKRAGLAAFLRAIRVAPELVDALVPAPLPRGYRTTSRRRAEFSRGRARLAHGGGGDARTASPLEPAAHGAVYATVERLLAAMTPAIAHAVNHVILRGSYEQLVLILNVRALDARIVRSVRTLAERVAERHPAVQHAWIYHDPTGSRYYLELERPVSGVGAKKLFGAAAWRQQVGDVSHQVGVFSFTQVNLAMAPLLVDTVKRHAQVARDDVLWDLYCGYGLFAAAFAKDVARLVAVDADDATVDNARWVVQRAGGKVTALCHALRGGEDIARLARAAGRPAPRPAPQSDSRAHRAQRAHDAAERPSSDPPRAQPRGNAPAGGARHIVLLDPPRAGTPPGLIAAVTEVLRPGRAVEVFCGPEELARSVEEWAASGYPLERLTPLDLFPGTTGLELVASFAPAC